MVMKRLPVRVAGNIRSERNTAAADTISINRCCLEGQSKLVLAVAPRPMKRFP